ncbi:MAG: Clp protease N-terminal domain-containing protein [Hyphomonas sp.]
MNIEQYTERARAIIQGAQTAALAAGHQVLTPAHVLKEMLEDRDQMAVNLIRASGGLLELRYRVSTRCSPSCPRSAVRILALRLEQAWLPNCSVDAEAQAKAA